MAPTFRSGKNAYFSITSATGGTIVLTSGLTDATMQRVAQALKVTTFGRNDEVYIPGLRDGTLKLSGIFASTYEKKLTPLLGSTAGGTWVFGPESTVATRRKFTGASVVTDLQIQAAVADTVNVSLSLQLSGGVTSTNF